MTCQFSSYPVLSSITRYLDTRFCILKLPSVHSGLLSTAGYAVYAQHVAVEYFNPNFDDLKWVTNYNGQQFQQINCFSNSCPIGNRQAQVRSGNPAVPGMGRLRLSHDRWFLLPVVGVHVTLRRQRDVSVQIQKMEMAKQKSINNFPVEHNPSFASSCLMCDPAGFQAFKVSILKNSTWKLLFLCAGLCLT